MVKEVFRRIVARVPKEADTVGGGVTRHPVQAAHSTSAGERILSRNLSSELVEKMV